MRLQNQYLRKIEPPSPGRANFVRYALKIMTEKSYEMMRDSRVQEEARKHRPELARRKAAFNRETGVAADSLLGRIGEPFGLLLVATVQITNMGRMTRRVLHDVSVAGIGHDPLDAMIHGLDDPARGVGMCRARPGELSWKRQARSFTPSNAKSVSYETFWIQGSDLEVLIKPTLPELSALAESLKLW